MLTFDPVEHRYTLNGRVVPSVTTVLQIVERSFDFVDPVVLERARSFGSHVHLACHLVNIGELDESTLDPHLAPYVAQWKQFLFETKFEVTHSEERVASVKLGYAGTLDNRGKWPTLGSSIGALVDLKSGAVPHSVGLQTAAYAAACDLPPRRRYCVQLMPDRYKLIRCAELTDYSYFLSALNIYKFKHARK